MADTDLIACLYPFMDRRVDGQEAKKVIEENKNRYIPPRLIKETERPQLSRRSRESTPLEQPRKKVPAYFYHPGLELRFSRGPQTPYGFVFGRDRNSDVVLECGIQSLSAHHFALTFDEHYRPIIKDLGSSNGTEVTYDKQGEGRRSDFVWIIGGHGIPQEKDIIVITINKNLKFQIVVARHDITSQRYIDNVNRFRQGTANAENLFGRLDLRSRPQTERASGAHTPGTGPIVLRKKLGEGTFGVVTHLWDVSTADEYALKEPSERAVRENRVRVDAWRKEAGIMSRLSHDYIVTLIDSDFTSVPRLRFEYVPGGTLADYADLSTGECLQILRQCLSALVYLHGHEPPIVHRDIKRSNILVRHRHPNNIYVKLGDFGISREGADPTTICGTPQYLAPEVYIEYDRRKAQYDKRSYTPAVDIWSLGVTVLECAYDLPSCSARGFHWCTEIVTKLARDLERDPDDLKQFLWDAMVIMKPELRETARYCYNEVLLLADRARDRLVTPTPASRDPEDQETILLQDTCRVTGTSESPSLDDDSTEIWRYIRSNGPPPQSIVPPSTRKRTKDSSSSSSRYAKRQAVRSQPPLSEVWDALHPLGGGSSLAAFFGQEVSDSNTSTIRASTPRSVQDTVDAQLSEVYSPGPDPYLVGGGAFVLAGAQVVAIAPTDSEQELAAKLLVEISQGR
ncbi:kinase-like domain-containing protein [Corynascus novoguineensis]|uniref:Kinase-like domain-containing protein n=1 Tax=Corynascus novoguineensis TaxID=1126955 RepID=A0AAN7CMB1_9PEZI|nr:kinase-like domain-containing protein [Corynascus novoguineensis]